MEFKDSYCESNKKLHSIITAIDNYCAHMKHTSKLPDRCHIFKDDYDKLMKAATKHNKEITPDHLTRNGVQLVRFAS